MKFTRIVIGIMAVTVFATPKSHAQYGYGACPYGAEVGEEATSLQDEVDTINEQLKDLRERKKDIEKELRGLKLQVSAGQRKVQTYGLKETAYNFVSNHLDVGAENAGKTCCDYESVICETGKVTFLCASKENCSTSNKIGGGENVGPNVGKNSVSDFGSFKEWNEACDQTAPARVKAEVVCSISNHREGNLYKKTECVDGLKSWQSALDALRAKSKELEGIKAEETGLKAALGDVRKAKKAAQKEHQRELREEMSEGNCEACNIMGNGYVSQQRRMSTAETVGFFGLGALGMILGNNLNKYVSDNNARQGFQTQPYPAFGYGWPYLMAGLYGALGGGIGGGGFGCGGGFGGTGYGGMNMGGAFGYPMGMMGLPMGGGMYLPGMGPWGQAGPWGLGGGMGMPMGMMPGMGLGMGMPMGMMPGMGLGMGMPMGMMPGMGLGMGMPMGMMPGMGLGMGMPMGMMPGMGLGMGMPMGMMPGMGMGLGLGMPGLGMGMGMPFGMGMMPGMGLGLGMPMGMGMPGMMADGGAAMQMQMQMQQQAMQMQMQQYQQMMQMQQQQAQAAMQKTQILTSLQQELYNLMARIQQVQYSSSAGGYVGFSYSGQNSYGGPGVPMSNGGGSSTTLPVPGTPGSNR